MVPIIYSFKQQILLHVCVYELLSRVWLFATPWTVAHQASLSMGFSRQRILEGIAVPFSRGTSQPKDRTLVSCIAGRFFTIWATGKSVCFTMFLHLLKNQYNHIVLRTVRDHWETNDQYCLIYNESARTYLKPSINSSKQSRHELHCHGTLGWEWENRH